MPVHHDLVFRVEMGIHLFDLPGAIGVKRFRVVSRISGVFDTFDGHISGDLMRRVAIFTVEILRQHHLGLYSPQDAYIPGIHAPRTAPGVIDRRAVVRHEVLILADHRIIADAAGPKAVEQLVFPSCVAVRQIDQLHLFPAFSGICRKRTAEPKQFVIGMRA